MRIFISWSGPLSREVAQIIEARLSPLYDGARFFFSEKSIHSGEVWQKTLMSTLQESDFCIVCVTAESLASSWMNFEAGALAVVTQDNPGVTALLIDLPAEALSGHPLSWFQSTALTESGMKKLMATLHRRLHGLDPEADITDPVLLRQFDTTWTAIRYEVEAARARFAQAPAPIAPIAPIAPAAPAAPAGSTIVSWDEYIGLVRDLRAQLNQDPFMGGYNVHTIVGLHQGGLQTALILARMYDRHRQAFCLFADRLEHATSFEDSETARLSNRYVVEALKDPRSGQILVVDSVARTADTVLAARAFLARVLPAEKKVRYAVLVRDVGCPATLTDFCVREADTRRLLFPYQYAFR